MKKFIVILGFLIFGANIVFCQENKVIKDIKIEGNKNTKQEVIFTKMNTKVGSSLDSMCYKMI